MVQFAVTFYTLKWNKTLSIFNSIVAMCMKIKKDNIKDMERVEKSL